MSSLIFLKFVNSLSKVVVVSSVAVNTATSNVVGIVWSPFKLDTTKLSVPKSKPNPKPSLSSLFGGVSVCVKVNVPAACV